ncbi:MAG: NUDIX hydrolase [Planctomycetota bacterium]
MDLLKHFKSCPRCTSANLTVDKQKTIVCGHCQFTYYHNMAAAVAAIIEYQGRILLTRRAHEPAASMLDLPGGFVDYAETAEEALAREVYEELNLQIENMKYFTSAPNTYVYKDVLYHVLDILFVCPVAGIEGIQPRDDVSQFLFFRPDEVPIDQLAFESTKAALAHYIETRRD